MSILFFIQPGYSDYSIRLLWITMLVLFFFALLLFIASLTVRARHYIHDRKVKEYKEKFYTIILKYLDEDIAEEEIISGFSGKGLEYTVFENLIFEMLESFEGHEVVRLQELLFLSPIFDYHMDQLHSNKTIEQIKACKYFGYLGFIDYRVLKKLFSLLSSDNQILAFSAATACMSSEDVETRGYAIKSLVKRGRFSRMALLEMMYKFHDKQEEQTEEEAVILKNIIGDPGVPPETAGILIEGASEIGYHELIAFFTEKIRSSENRWNHPEILKVLIKAHADFYNSEVLFNVRKELYHPDREVRKAVAYYLDKIEDEKNLKALYNLLFDKDFEVRYAAAKSLYNKGEEGEKWLEKSYRQDNLKIRSLVNTFQ